MFKITEFLVTGNKKTDGVRRIKVIRNHRKGLKGGMM